VTTETEVLEQSGCLQPDELRFFSEVRAIQLSSSAATPEDQSPDAQIPHRISTVSRRKSLQASLCQFPSSRCLQASTWPQATALHGSKHRSSHAQHALNDQTPGEGLPHGALEQTCGYDSSCLKATSRPYFAAASLYNSSSAAQHAANWEAPAEELPCSALENAASRDSLKQALAAVGDFLLHGVLCMQPGALQTSYAVSALSFINAVQAARLGPCCAFVPILERLSSGVSWGQPSLGAVVDFSVAGDALNAAWHAADQLCSERPEQNRRCASCQSEPMPSSCACFGPPVISSV